MERAVYYYLPKEREWVSIRPEGVGTSVNGVLWRSVCCSEERERYLRLALEAAEKSARNARLRVAELGDAIRGLGALVDPLDDDDEE